MNSKRKKDNDLFPLTPDIEALMDKKHFYEDIPLTVSKKRLYDYSYNGQLIPFKSIKRKVGIIPYGWGYYPGRQYMATVIYAIDPLNNSYAVYKRSYSRFKQVTTHFTDVMKRYAEVHKKIADEYKKNAKEMTNEFFWNSYLGK